MFVATFERILYTVDKTPDGAFGRAQAAFHGPSLRVHCVHYSVGTLSYGFRMVCDQKLQVLTLGINFDRTMNDSELFLSFCLQAQGLLEAISSNYHLIDAVAILMPQLASTQECAAFIGEFNHCHCVQVSALGVVLCVSFEPSRERGWFTPETDLHSPLL